MTIMRKVCVFGTHHEFQFDTPMDSAFYTHLQELIKEHQVDCILEEAAGLPAKSCVELLADALGIRWANVDPTAEERKLVPDAALTNIYDTFLDLTLHAHRENVWAAKASEMVVNSVCAWKAGRKVVSTAPPPVKATEVRTGVVEKKTELPCNWAMEFVL